MGATPKDTTFYTLKGVCDEGEVKLSFVGGDACTPNSKLKWTYKIDLINTDLLTGTHKILWSFEDQCNVTTRSHIVTVRNNDKPTAARSRKYSSIYKSNGSYRYFGIPDIEWVVLLLHRMLAVTVWCCDELLKFSFSADVNDTIRCFDCLVCWSG
ncbi:MAG: hypothetical protein IPO94_13685 [Saprospiraceae bacterium]|nr:hypothetical protein [Saprospiraceae bacterium]